MLSNSSFGHRLSLSVAATTQAPLAFVWTAVVIAGVSAPSLNVDILSLGENSIMHLNSLYLDRIKLWDFFNLCCNFSWLLPPSSMTTGSCKQESTVFTHDTMGNRIYLWIHFVNDSELSDEHGTDSILTGLLQAKLYLEESLNENSCCDIQCAACACTDTKGMTILVSKEGGNSGWPSALWKPYVHGNKYEQQEENQAHIRS